jgi:hypothetical protein
MAHIKVEAMLEFLELTTTQTFPYGEQAVISHYMILDTIHLSITDIIQGLTSKSLTSKGATQ